VTAVADTLSADLAHLTKTRQELEARLEAATAQIKQLQLENAFLKSQLGST
jgi:predicted nuclease with TOPRIM domain